MKNVLFGVIAAGVVYLVIQDYRKSKKKCGCSGSGATSTPAASTTVNNTGTTSTPAIMPDAISAPLAATGPDGFKKPWA